MRIMTVDPLRVLHVDDQKLWRSTVSDYLVLFGTYLVTSAESGERALQLIRVQSFDIIISDYQMPEMNGMELLRQVRRVDGSIPFIFLSGIPEAELMEQGKESGVDFYVKKSGDPEVLFSDLSRKIYLAVQKRTAVQALRDYQQERSEPFC